MASSPPERIRVVLADDHAFYRQGLAKMLAESGIEVVAEASDGRTAIDAVAAAAPDVVVMDLNMRGLSGVDATRRLTERTPASRVLVLTVSADEAQVTDAILAGATGYVLKDAPIEDVVAGIRAAAAGEALISPRIAALLLEGLRKRETAEAETSAVPLTGREREVMKLIAEGKTNDEIAGALHIGVSTVRNHVSSILVKLQVDNRVQAAVRAVRDHII